MSTLELTDQIEEKRNLLSSLLKTAEAEERQLTAEETATFDAVNAEIRTLSDELNTLKDNLTEKRTNNNSTMETPNFSLIKAINDVVNNRTLDEATQNVINAGIEEMRAAGQSYSGQIQLPIENRALNGIITGSDTFVSASKNGGKEAIATETLDILEPLRANMVLADAGATFLTGLTGNLTIPVMDKTNVAWAGETATATNGTPTFSKVEFTPKRLTAYVNVSKQFLNQTSPSAEAILKNDIIKAVADKLEATILGSAAGSTTQPAGIFNGITADTTDASYAGIVALEETLESANVGGEYVYIVNPTAKAVLRTTQKGNGTGFIMENGEIEGKKVLTTSNVVAKGVAVGDFSDLVIANWGAWDITVDPYTAAKDGQIVLVVNAYFDAKPRRAVSIAKEILK